MELHETLSLLAKVGTLIFELISKKNKNQKTKKLCPGLLFCGKPLPQS